MPFDLDAYLARIGHTGARQPTREVLAEIQWRHICAIPFENFDIHLGRPIRLEPEAVQRKLVSDRRGGYCFEQNALFRMALRALGFTVQSHIARVRWQVPADVLTAKTHMILIVELAGRRYLADAGFGSGSLGAPLSLETDASQCTPQEPRRIVHRGGELIQQMDVGGDWSDLYVFTLQPALEVDYEVANWFTSTHPQSRFVQNVVGARTFAGGRYTLLNREFTTRWTDGRTEKRELATPEALRSVLAEAFTVNLPAEACRALHR